MSAEIEIIRTACPHDCPSACALEVERLSRTRIGRIRGAANLPFTAGVVCEKVGRYAERVHHPDRLTHPMRRIGAKGKGKFERISWDEALDTIAAAFNNAANTLGAESVWPYHSGGTLGIVQRFGMERLSRLFGYSGMKGTICVTPGVSGWQAGVGAQRGADPVEIEATDLIVVWGGNPVHTNVNLMNHIQKARKTNGAKLVVVDVYRTSTMAAADIGIVLNPGTDGALACAMMQVMLAEGMADETFLAELTDFDTDVRTHLAEKTPEWSAEITGIPAAEIRAFARLYGRTAKSFLRLGVGFTRSRNGASNMHAVSCLPAITGAWRHKGGGAFFASFDIWNLDTTLAHAADLADNVTRVLDQSRIGAVLCGDEDALAGGPPVKAMLIQNSNTAMVAPDSAAVRRGLSREDLFVCVHEHFMTPTARYADILLPAAMFLELDDIYMGWGHTALTIGPRVLDDHAECRSNVDVVNALAKRLGADHPSVLMSSETLVDATLQASKNVSLADAAKQGWIDCGPDFDDAHFLTGFPHPDGRFRFKPDWAAIGPYHDGMPSMPDHWAATDTIDADRPLRLVTPPSRTYLNTSFSETPGSRKREGRPTALVHPQDAAELGIADGAKIRIGNRKGEVSLHAEISDAAKPGIVISEGVWPDDAFEGGIGINLLIDATPVPPAGGAAFHDTAIWLKAAAEEIAGAAD
ncbi:MAG: molybdopterin oxidoreductase family protein [Alphaproteobacteria bacterium]|nr:molybdopterin oxidoreductase family protein [Alphaproteobacteria bacterium]